ncbi:MAG: cysteine synthase family protein [Gammaproteobacteria bacterium]|nr:cysteine synthase family protein [Gammaproteobacteria bacterium]MCH9744190.1 cysteine synthase family protein [Gammaproteobacteria bacterium]
MSKIYKNIESLVGNTPLVRLSTYSYGNDVSVIAKCEMFNPSLSIKDRIVLAMIDDFENKGKLQPGGTIIEASSGNTGSSLAMLAAVRGYKAIITTPAKTSEEKVATMRAFGATVYVCPGVPKSLSEHYVNKAHQLHKQIPGSVILNQYENPLNPHAHYLQTAQEIWDDLDGNVDYVVAGSSSGGTISGIGRFFKEKNPRVKIIMPDPVGSIYFDYYRSKQEHRNICKPYKIEGIGKDYICKTIDFSVIDAVMQVTDQQAFDTAKSLAKQEGLLAGGSAGAVVYVAKTLAEQCSKEKKKANIVVILADSGFKYLSKFYASEAGGNAEIPVDMHAVIG